MKTILVDFDGVIHSYITPWEKATIIPDVPVAGALAWLEQALAHFHVCIYSSRSQEAGGIAAMREWLMHHGMSQEVLDRINFPTHKPPAHMTIDDRGFRFEGQFPDMETVEKFIPWNRRNCSTCGYPLVEHHPNEFCPGAVQA